MPEEFICITQQERNTLDIYALDLETDTTIEGRDPSVSSITEASITSLENNKLENFVYASVKSPEVDLLTKLERHLKDKEGILLTWNGCNFDLPFLSDRSLLTGTPLSLKIKKDPSLILKYPPLIGHAGGYQGKWGNLLHVDICYYFKTIAAEKNIVWSLKPVYKALTGKEPVAEDRENLHLLSPERRKAYAASDTNITLELFELVEDNYIEQYLKNTAQFMS